MPKEFGIDIDPPPGTIVMWDDALANIPTGWYLCDGNNGTPNLLDRFIRGAPAGTDPGATGGEHSKALSESQLPSHDHTTDLQPGGSHDHGLQTWNGESWSGRYAEFWENSGHTSQSTEAGSHAHTATLPSAGGGSAYDNRPEFYEVAFIMKA